MGMLYYDSHCRLRMLIRFHAISCRWSLIRHWLLSSLMPLIFAAIIDWYDAIDILRYNTPLLYFIPLAFALIAIASLAMPPYTLYYFYSLLMLFHVFSSAIDITHYVLSWLYIDAFVIISFFHFCHWLLFLHFIDCFSLLAIIIIDYDAFALPQ